VTPKLGGPPPSVSVGPEDGTEDGDVVGPSVGPEVGREVGTEVGLEVDGVGAGVGLLPCPGLGALLCVPLGDKVGELVGPFVGPEDGREDGAEVGFFVGAPTGESVIPFVEDPKGAVGDLVGDMVGDLVSADPLPLAPPLPHPQANCFVYWHCCTLSEVLHLGGGVALSSNVSNLESCT
jgi:hypothetical protein